jgi:hypothetical protein
MKYLLALLLLCSTAWGANYVNGTSFDTEAHSAIVVLMCDDWPSEWLVDRYDANGLRAQFNAGRAFCTSDATQSAILYALNSGHEIASHGMTSQLAGRLWYEQELDSLVSEITDSKAWLDSLCQTTNSGYECVNWSLAGNDGNLHTDSLGLLTYDMVRREYRQYNDDSSGFDYIYGYEHFMFPDLWRVVDSEHAPNLHTRLNKDTTNTDTTGIRAGIQAWIDQAKQFHTLSMTTIHPAGLDSCEDMTIDQFDIYLDTFASDTAIWVTTMDTLYKALGPNMRASWDDWQDVYFDSARTTDAYAFGAGTASDPFALDTSMFALDAFPFYNVHFHLGDGEFNIGGEREIRYPFKMSGNGMDRTTVSFADYGTQGIYGGFLLYNDTYHAAGEKWFCEDIVISDLAIYHNYAEGRPLVIQCQDVEIKDCKFSDDGGGRQIYSSYQTPATSFHIHDCLFEPSSSYTVEISSAEPDSFRFNNNVIENSFTNPAIRLDDIGNFHIYNNLFLPQVNYVKAIMLYDTTGGDKTTLYTYNNLMCSQDALVSATPFTYKTTGITFANWTTITSNWKAGNSNGTMTTDNYMASPYTTINTCSDTVRWGGCQTESLPARSHGWSSYGIGMSNAPTISGRFTTPTNADSLVDMLGWAWAAGDTIRVTDWDEWIEPHTLMLQMDVGRPDHWRGGFN